MNHECYKVIVKDGKQFLTYKGEILPNQIESIVTQHVDNLYKKGKAVCEISIKVIAVLDDTKN